MMGPEESFGLADVSSIEGVKFHATCGLYRRITLGVVAGTKVDAFTDAVLLDTFLAPDSLVVNKKLGRPISTTPASVAHELTTCNSPNGSWTKK